MLLPLWLLNRTPPGWVPYRFRSSWETMRVERHLEGVWRTAPFEASPANRASAELFMLVCRRDITTTLLSTKSLLRHCPGRLAVSLIDDGSLRQQDREEISRHLPGCRWLDAREPSMAAGRFEGRPLLWKLWESRFPLRLKLLLPFMCGRLPRVIVMDSDTAFFSRPDQLIEWMNSGGEALYLHDARRDGRDEAPAQLRTWLGEVSPRLAPGRQWRLNGYYFNSGLLAFEPEKLDLSVAERMIECLEEVPPGMRDGALRPWYGDWVREQMSFMAMYAFLDPPPRSLEEGYSIEEPEDRGFCHFLRSGLVKPGNLALLGGLIKAIVTEHPNKP